MKAVFLLCAFFILPIFAGQIVQASFKWTSCGTAADHFQVQAVAFSPDPAIRGQNVTTRATGYQDETVTGGTWETKVYYGFLPVDSFSGPVCALIPTCKCPCPSGTYTTVQSLPVIAIAPPGLYNGKYQAWDQNNQQLTCIAYEFNVL